MTQHTVLGILAGHMIRILNAFKVFTMAAVAFGGRSTELPAHMAQPAIHGYVSTGQRKLRVVMMECRGLPRVRRMAFRAALRKLLRGMIGILGGFEIRSVTIVTKRRGARELSVEMTKPTIGLNMRAGERES